MNMTETINGHHSIWTFLSKSVKKKKLDSIFSVSARSPSWADTEHWKIFVVTGVALYPAFPDYVTRFCYKYRDCREDCRQNMGAMPDRFLEKLICRA
jgi:hypothetical protein